jgi:hypothetical protein
LKQRWLERLHRVDLSRSSSARLRPLRVIRTNCNFDVQAAASHRKLPPTLCVPEGRLRVDRRRMQIDDRQAATPVWHSPAFGRCLPFVNVFFRYAGIPVISSLTEALGIGLVGCDTNHRNWPQLVDSTALRSSWS